MTQVVLPAELLVRRRDAVAVIGRAWRQFAAGAGSRRVAHLLGVPMETVRGWLRRLRDLARAMHARSRQQDDRSRQRDDRSRRLGDLAFALARVIASARAEGWRQEADLWRCTSYRFQGRLLSNTN